MAMTFSIVAEPRLYPDRQQLKAEKERSEAQCVVGIVVVVVVVVVASVNYLS